MINQIFLVSVGASLALYLHRAGEGKEPYQMYIGLYLGLILLTSIVAAITTDVLHIRNNLFIFHIYTPFEYCVLSLLFRSSVDNRILKKVIATSIPVFIVVCALLSAFWQTIEFNNSIASVIEGILIILWAVLFLREVLLRREEESLQRIPMFWITMGILFYFVGNQVIDGLLNYFMGISMDLARQLYRFSYVFRFILIALLSIAILSRRLFSTSQQS